MSILKIARMGHPILREEAVALTKEQLAYSEVQRLIDDMFDTLDEYDGVGLAAPQVHASIRVVLLELKRGAGIRVWVNPVITPLSEELQEDFEGCLSIPDIRGSVARYNHIDVKAWDREGTEVHLELRGFAAVVAQHECDHLDGVLFIDKANPKSLTFLEERRRYGDYPWEEDDETGEE